MRLTLQTDYALRMLMQLAVRKNDLITIADIAGSYGVSKNHISKVAQRLVALQAVQSVRGRTGGLMLARPAQQIALGTVVRHLESQSALVECFPGGQGGCHITSACKLKGILAEAQEAFFSVLDQYSVQDLVGRNAALADLLGETAA